MKKNILSKMRIKVELSLEIIKLLNDIQYLDQEEDLLKTQIRKYLKKNYPLDVLAKNWREITKLGKDSSTLHSYIVRYGEEYGKKLHTEKTNACTTTKQDFIDMYGLEEATKLLSSRGASLTNFISRHGKIDGEKRWLEYCEKRSASYNIGKEENRYASRDLEWFKNKHGDERGYQIWNKKRLAQAYKVSKKYYIEEYGEILGPYLCQKTKSRSLQGFVEKYGIDEGTERYISWKNKILESFRSRKSYSKWAFECCISIKESVRDLYYFGNNEMIWELPDKYKKILKQKLIMPDLFYRGKVIEFMGDLFHANPLIYESHSTPQPFNKNIKAEDIWLIDRNRKEYYIEKGYEYLEIWESSYKLNKKEVIERCVNFLK